MSNSYTIGVLGAGSWGTALAQLLCKKNYDVTLWAREKHVAEEINKNHRNPIYVSQFELHTKINATHDFKEAVSGKNVLVIVVPSHAIRQVMTKAKPYMDENPLIISASKGIETETLETMGEVLCDILPKPNHDSICFLSGPSFAVEVLREMPTAVTIASYKIQAAQQACKIFSGDFFRAYSSNDVIGVELGGALKNVIAIAAGMCDGMGFGANSRAALITRGLSEIAQLGKKMGADPITFLGLSGMGDLILTCTGDLSRNRMVGMKLGQGKKLSEILKDMKMVAEGIKTAKAVYNLAKRENVEMFICSKIYELLYENADIKKIIPEMMSRSLKSEFHWIENENS